MNTIKAFVAALFIAATALPASAQEQYEQMMVIYNMSYYKSKSTRPLKVLAISKENGEYTEEVTSKSDLKGDYDITPALSRIKQLAGEGWELYHNSSPSHTVYIFHLRRPLK
jgi:hypothetical protein